MLLQQDNHDADAATNDDDDVCPLVIVLLPCLAA